MKRDPLEIGRLKGAAPGPTLVLIGGLHGNEPAGVEAARNVLQAIEGLGANLTGELVAFAANRPALAEGRRYLGRDLNRQWTTSRLAEARLLVSSTPDPDPELCALVELADALDETTRNARGPVFVIDLHTTSAEGIPFVLLGPTAKERAFARTLPLPGIMGLQESLEGVLPVYLCARGCVALAVEGGQNANPESVLNLEAVALLALETAGLLCAEAMPGLPAARARLERARGNLPQLIEVVARHANRPGFRMEPGFANIHRTEAGTLLARERDAEIRAPFDGLLLLPLYQTLGEDGFFYGRER